MGHRPVPRSRPLGAGQDASRLESEGYMGLMLRAVPLFVGGPFCCKKGSSCMVYLQVHSLGRLHFRPGGPAPGFPEPSFPRASESRGRASTTRCSASRSRKHRPWTRTSGFCFSSSMQPPKPFPAHNISYFDYVISQPSGWRWSTSPSGMPAWTRRGAWELAPVLLHTSPCHVYRTFVVSRIVSLLLTLKVFT